MKFAYRGWPKIARECNGQDQAQPKVDDLRDHQHAGVLGDGTTAAIHTFTPLSLPGPDGTTTINVIMSIAIRRFEKLDMVGIISVDWT